MGEHTKIEWAHHTFNSWVGCVAVSPGCDNCYAEALAHRHGWHDWQNTTPRHLTSDAYWRQPLRWNTRAATTGIPERVFCGSMMDIFDPHAPTGARERLWALIAATPWLQWLLLTKRPANAIRMLPDGFNAQTWPNIWLGISAEDQEHYDRRWPILQATPAVVRFVSYEPALGPVRFGMGIQPDWCIVGGESGPGARPMDPQWARDMIYDCRAHRVPVFLKQWGTYTNNPLSHDGAATADAKLADPKTNGKGGALLDGRLWRQVPVVKAQPRRDMLFASSE